MDKEMAALDVQGKRPSQNDWAVGTRKLPSATLTTPSQPGVLPALPTGTRSPVGLAV